MQNNPRQEKLLGEPAESPTVDHQCSQEKTSPAQGDLVDPGPVDALLPGHLDRLCDEFDAAWKAGHTPRIEDFLDRADGTSLGPLLRQLLSIEIDYRLVNAQELSSEDYEQRFPKYRELVRETVQARLRNPGTQPLVTEASLPRVLGDYEVFEKLGGGGMGVVYKARHRRLQRWVAIKRLRPGCLADSEALRRFTREMEAVGRLNHANLVQCTDAREEAGVHFLVMEYIEGLDLAAIVNQRGPLTTLSSIVPATGAWSGSTPMARWRLRPGPSNRRRLSSTRRAISW